MTTIKTDGLAAQSEQDIRLPNQRSRMTVQDKYPKRPRRTIGQAIGKTQSPQFEDGLKRVAIVGMSGRFPKADTPEAFWELLVAEQDAIENFPYWDLPGIESRQSLADGFSGVGGFINQATRFDADFFQISAREVQAMDPQQRIVLEATWSAFESAGLCPNQLRGSNTGVFIGVSSADYNGLLAQSAAGAHDATGNAHSIMANRISYLFDFHGPSAPIDTACSSSLVAVHRAAKAILNGDCSIAVAGGVNLCFEPMVFVGATKAGMLSPDGRCKTFAEDANGYVRGEGVGIVILKEFEQARADGDPILATIIGSAENHGGQANSLTAPNAGAQAALLKQAYQHIDINSIDYIEAHGTGTKLGDPIELRALKEAFTSLGRDRNVPCFIGSVKTNIGHLESAAGIAGTLKVVQMLRHGFLPKSLHAEALNPFIDFTNSPFEVVQQGRPWPEHQHSSYLRAGVSSFGFGGANAHVVLEAYPEPTAFADVGDLKYVFPLSAKTNEALQQRAKQLLDFLQRYPETHLQVLAATLQLGRESMDERRVLIAKNREQLLTQLQSFVVRGIEKSISFSEGLPTLSDALLEFVKAWCARSNDSWSALYPNQGKGIQRMALPTYPFAGDHYWIAAEDSPVLTGNPHQPSLSHRLRLHHLVHQNISDLMGQRFYSEFSGDEFFFSQHQVNHHKILPGVAYLEMVRAAVELSLPEGEQLQALEQILWQRPMIYTGKPLQVELELSESQQGWVQFEVFAGDETRSVFCKGIVKVGNTQPLATIELASLQSECTKSYEARACYSLFEQMGLEYGPDFQCIESLKVGSQQVLAVLKCLHSDTETAAYECPMKLSPGLMDSALQAALGLALGEEDAPANTASKHEPLVPFALESVTWGDTQSLGEYCYAWIRPAIGHDPEKLNKLDVDLCNAEGEVALSLRGFTSKRMPAQTESVQSTGPAVHQPIVLQPIWQSFIPESREAVPSSEGSRQALLFITDDAVTHDWRKAWSRVIKSNHHYVYAQHVALNIKNPTKALTALVKIMTDWMLPAENPLSIQVVFLDSTSHGVQTLPSVLVASLPAFLRTVKNEGLINHFQLLHIRGQMNASQSLKLAYECQHQSEEWLRVDVTAKTQSGSQPAYQRLTWEHTIVAPAVDTFWRDQGVYLITGGLGGVGLLIAQAIANSTQGAQIILAGRNVRQIEQTTQDKIDVMVAQGASVHPMVLDVTQAKQVKILLADIERRFGGLQGIFHCAGATQDGLLKRKTLQGFSNVLAPKVSGSLNLDRASAHMALDAFVLFSSASAIMGTPGQSDYALANSYEDAFAHWRQQQVLTGKRQGKTLSVNWPLWEEGGMQIPQAQQEAFYQQTGIAPLSTSVAMHFLEAALLGDSGTAQWLLFDGDIPKIKTFLAEIGYGQPSQVPSKSTNLIPDNLPTESEAPPKAATVQPGIESRPLDFKPHLIQHLTQLLGKTLNRPPAKIDSDASFERYGADSILLTELTNQLENQFGALSNTLLYEYQTLNELADYFLQHHANKVADLYQADIPVQATTNKAPTQEPLNIIEEKINPDVSAKPLHRKRRREQLNSASPIAQTSRDIAIIGISGRYPGASDLETFWNKIAGGTDLITEIPESRWHHSEFFDTDPTRMDKTNSRWGGFLEDVESFDPLFFHISPKEAEIINPNDRLFLEECWNLLERTGLTRQQLKQHHQNKVGVFVGAMYQQYQAFESDLVRESLVSVTSYSAIANRVSYFFGFQGPSMAIDTMCSSAISAIHTASESLFNGDCELAIAGAVNLTLHPKKYIGLGVGQVLGSQLTSRSFADGDGYLPSEGVGAVLLKPLAAAERDGDDILAVIKGTAVNHNGHTHGFSVPSVQAQVNLMEQNFKRSGVDPSSISYIESAANGSAMGDAIEFSALQRVFKNAGVERSNCALGAVKSNVGHGEAVSGMMQLSKLVLQFQHRQLAPTLVLGEPNPKIDFANAAFQLQRTLETWETTEATPRRAMLNALGAGGSNGHLILEEYSQQRLDSKPDSFDQVGFREKSSPHFISQTSTQYLIPISAHSLTSLVGYLRKLLHFLEVDDKSPSLRIEDIAYSLQMGREPMEHRLMMLATSLDQLKAHLTSLIEAHSSGEFLDVISHNSQVMVYGNVEEVPAAVANLLTGVGASALSQQLISANERQQLAVYWSQGGEVPWLTLSENTSEHHPVKMRVLPTYAFDRRRCWLEQNFQAKTTLQDSNTEELPEITTPLTVGESFSVKQLISEVLGVDAQEILPAKPLSAYGLDSISMAQLVMKLQLEVLDGISLTDIQDCHSLMDMDRVVQKKIATLKQQNAQSGNMAVSAKTRRNEHRAVELQQLNQSQQGRPIFWFHGALGGCEMYSPLANRINRPFYGIQARGWMTDREPLKGLPAMAEFYIKLIESVQQQGPYDLGGYSLGGMLAYEVTRQLQTRGQSVNSIVMLDTPDVTGDRVAQLSDKTRFLQTINMALQLTLGEQPERFKEILIHRDDIDLSLSIKAFMLQLTSIARKRGLKLSDTRLMQNARQDTRIQKSYQVEQYQILPLPVPDEVDCVYFRNTSGLWLGELEPYFSTDTKEFSAFNNAQYWTLWEKLLPHIRMVDVDAACHMTLLTEPHVFQVIADVCKDIYHEDWESMVG